MDHISEEEQVLVVKAEHEVEEDRIEISLLSRSIASLIWLRQSAGLLPRLSSMLVAHALKKAKTKKTLSQLAMLFHPSLRSFNYSFTTSNTYTFTCKSSSSSGGKKRNEGDFEAKFAAAAAAATFQQIGPFFCLFILFLFSGRTTIEL